MATEQDDAFAEFQRRKAYLDRAISMQAHYNDAIVRELLGRWVSELEPAVACDARGNIIGLTVANAPIGSKPFVLRRSESE